MPDLRNCRRCGRMYNFIGGAPICQDCKNADEEVFKKVKDYLYDNPGATLSQVAMELDVSVEKIKMFLKEGRLEITDESNIILECERCGKSIKTGRFCRECQNEVSVDLEKTTKTIHLDNSDQNRSNGIGMRYLNKKL
ncbi:MerR family transcriptional regulator [Ruminiclostridium cellulolyticum]|uniref:Regulatory protein, MerR n=1 Tax=Ruminiclostridium cellulolyticum (strain ATCC 35319 / DSM 5812 / JCM 6584 / H10) TaxID=394503 RepID=B8I4C5_RUMCH|nr:MerR family transcriptional regulator [Ruminiclostridium cellulolyticum]ACL74479.1 regulatory protein, MerR [Ruminiclostridium cellulolyticum H10]